MGRAAGKSRKVRGPPSGEPVAAVVARGEAEIGFQQVSELIRVPGITFVGTIPADVQPMIFFAGALTSTVQQPEAASALIRFLASPEVAPVILKAGLMPLSTDSLAPGAAHRRRRGDRIKRDVRYWHLADIPAPAINVRFWGAYF